MSSYRPDQIDDINLGCHYKTIVNDARRVCYSRSIELIWLEMKKGRDIVTTS
jgi:hypothetical protein